MTTEENTAGDEDAMPGNVSSEELPALLPVKRERNHSLDMARILMAFGVILGHVCYCCCIDRGLTEYGASWWLTATLHVCSRPGVPLFVMVSGAFLLSPDSKTGVFEFWRRRMDKILIPLLFWTVIGALLRKATDVKMIFSMANLESAFQRLIQAPLTPTDGILWYLYMAAILYFLAPFLRRILAHSSAKEAWVLVAGLFMVNVLDPGFAQRSIYTKYPYYSYCFIFFLGYFLAGQLLYRYQVRIGTGKLVAIVLAGAVFSLVLKQANMWAIWAIFAV